MRNEEGVLQQYATHPFVFGQTNEVCFVARVRSLLALVDVRAGAKAETRRPNCYTWTLTL